jgi:hypothetical protein
MESRLSAEQIHGEEGAQICEYYCNFKHIGRQRIDLKSRFITQSNQSFCQNKRGEISRIRASFQPPTVLAIANCCRAKNLNGGCEVI